MKMDMDWHKRCLANRIESLARDYSVIKRLSERYNDAEEQITTYKQQVFMAEKEKRNGFDRDKYLLKRKKS